MIHEVQMGKRTRMSFARIEEALPVPDLIEVQKNSYQHFLKVDLKEVLADVSPITDYNDTLVLEFIDYSLDSQPKNTVERCKERDQTFAAPLKVKVRLTNRETHDVSESEVFIGDFPLMTEHGTFVINGAERVIVSQLVRSPGVYYEKTIDKAGRFTYAAKMIPNRGAWLEYECDANDVFSVRIDRTRKVPITALLRALGLSSDADITAVLGEDERLTATFAADQSKNTDQALMEIYKRLRPGEPPTVDSARNLLNGTFFDPKKYDLARVGRYKYNKKLAIAARIAGRVLSQDVVNPHTAEVMAPAGTTLTREMAEQIQNVGVNTVFIQGEDREIRIVGNNFVRFDEFFKDYSPEMYEQYLREREEYIAEKGVEPLKLFERVHAPALQELIDVARADGAPILQVLTENVSRLIPKHVLIDDIISSVSYQLTLPYGVGTTDDIDHLGNRRLRSVGELLQNQIRVGLARLERIVKERMATQDPTKVRPQDLINIRPMSAA
ncbi:MAG: DNA-directed RNA polymerase subunit beta, partial [Eubacteriales bacterium]|nr:DNA-directed RNA polymerase subunit beta [Eubacteriales bacterium]